MTVRTTRAARPDPVEAAVDSFLHRHPGATVDEVADHLWAREQKGDFTLFGPLEEQARRYRLDETTRLLVRMKRFPLGARRYFVTTRPTARSEYCWYPREKVVADSMPAEERKAAIERHERLLMSAPFTMISNTLAVLRFLGADIERYRHDLHRRLDEAVDQAYALANGDVQAA